MASNLIISDGLQPSSNDRQPIIANYMRPFFIFFDLCPKIEMASSLLAMASNLVAMASNLIANYIGPFFVLYFLCFK